MIIIFPPNKIFSSMYDANKTCYFQQVLFFCIVYDIINIYEIVCYEALSQSEGSIKFCLAMQIGGIAFGKPESLDVLVGENDLKLGTHFNNMTRSCGK